MNKRLWLIVSRKRGDAAYWQKQEIHLFLFDIPNPATIFTANPNPLL
jgi:hypothetical protein